MTSNPRFGIICADEDELAPFLSQLTHAKKTEKAALTFHEGKLEGVSVIALSSGICKVNAAIAAQLLIDFFCPDAVINAGTAGGIAENVGLLDVVVSERTAYHDVESKILTNHPPYLHPAAYFPADSRLLAAARACSQQSAHPMHFGTTVTGEQFITDEGRERISAAFSPLSVDMETAAVAHVCYVNRIPFLAIRSITDTASHRGSESFHQNCAAAAAISAETVLALLRALSRTDTHTSPLHYTTLHTP